jgi:DNA gyrase subunit A
MQKMYDGSIVSCNNAVLVKELIHLRDDGDKIDHCCLAGDTQILYSNMQKITLKELADMGTQTKFNVLSKDKNLCTVNAQACNAHKAKTVDTYIEIELENKCIVKCTLDHKFMLKDGTYKEAQHLTTEDDLMEY